MSLRDVSCSMVRGSSPGKRAPGAIRLSRLEGIAQSPRGGIADVPVSPDHQSGSFCSSHMRFQLGRALMWVASAFKAGHWVAGFGIPRDQRINIVT